MSCFPDVDATRNIMSTEVPVIDLDVFITGSHNTETVVQERKKIRFFKIK